MPVSDVDVACLERMIDEKMDDLAARFWRWLALSAVGVLVAAVAAVAVATWVAGRYLQDIETQVAAADLVNKSRADHGERLAVLEAQFTVINGQLSYIIRRMDETDGRPHGR